MKLTIKDRYLIPQILQNKGKIIEMIICRSILKLAEFSIDEIKEFNLKDLPNGGISWDLKTEREVEIPFSDEQISLLKKSIEKLDSEGLITLDILTLCDKIDS